MNGTPSPRGSFGARGSGQTTQDFVIGMGIFLVAVAFAFATVPSFAGSDALSNGSGTGPGDSDAYAQADRLATTILDDLETGEKPNELDGERLEGAYENESADGTLSERLGLRTVGGDPIESVQISLETIDGETELLTRGDANVDDRAAVPVERLVTVGGVRECQPACRLIVRVSDR